MANKPRWTDDQLCAIEARGHTVLVSAAAGSGKTAVLTERAIQRMLDEHDPIEADRLLVVTFTRAAAQEMKQRMMQKLIEHIAQNPMDIAARRQRQLLDRAIIGTIDSLCLNLLRENWQKIGLPAAFRVGDSQELEAMREEAVGAALEAAYANRDDEAFGDLTELLSQRRGDQSLAGTILKVLDFARTHPFYREWLDEKLKTYENFSDPAQSVWGKILMQYALETVERCKIDNEVAVAELGDEPEFANYFPAFSADAKFFTMLLSSLERNDWDNAVDVVRGYSAIGLKAVSRSASAERKEQLKRLRGRNKKIIEKLQTKVLTANLSEFSQDVFDLLPKLRRLFELVKDTDSRLFDHKCAVGIFEFSDLEQFAASLLMEHDENGNDKKTPLAQELSIHFGEIMVDEYQDVNAVQDMIINALSNGKNLFLVGDVKQSIYRFRQAQPEIFLRRSDEYRSNREPTRPSLITLRGNFRSRIEVTEAINRIFTPLFSKRVGDLVYDDSHNLEALASYPHEQNAGVQFHLLEQGTLKAVEAAEAEAFYVANEIKRMLDDGAQVTESGILRTAQPSDIAILLRSPKAHAEVYRRALEHVGIEAFAALESGFLSSTEIMAVLNLLRALDNPTRDIELIGAMMSPMFGFTDDELSQIRLLSPSGHFFTALKKAAAQYEHAREFLEDFEQLRCRSLTISASELITEAVELTGFDLLCRAEKGGRQRFANLHLLAQYAEQYHQNGHRGLAAFLKIIDQVTLKGNDLAPAYVGEQRNAVVITSIHKSKGLEWPIVFLCDAGRDHSFFRNDLINPTILHSDLGFACVRRDHEQKKQFATVPLEAVRIESARAMLSEELRILYVATTRAKERLIITAAMKKALQKAEELSPDGITIAPAQVRECKNYAEWLLMALGCYGDVAQSFRLGSSLAKINLHFDFLENKEEPKSPEDEQQLKLQLDDSPAFSLNNVLAETIRHRLEFKYPFAEATSTPAKLAVSQITHPNSDEYRFSQKPSFAEENRAAGNERGTAVHAFMQFCDYTAASQNSSDELERLKRDGILTERQCKLVDLPKIELFFKSKLAKRIFAAREVMREFAFMVSAAECKTACELATPNGEAPMLQGIADCIIIENDHAVVIDYKTDRVKNVETLCERYSLQLKLYREMLGSVLPVPVTECIIWSFELGCQLDV